MDIRRLFTSAFGLGRLPVAPGTWGSLPAAVLFGLLCYLHTPATSIFIVMSALVLAASFACIRFSPYTISATGKKDPGEVVIDEVAGQAITFLPVIFLNLNALSNIQIFETTLLGFLLFRIFDIIKPWPIRRLEKFPEGWGILADDLLAGVYAGFALLLCIKTGLIEYLSGGITFESTALDIPKAVILGIIQGATEFLPVSSSGHLVLFENLFKLNSETPEMLLFDLAVHLGTVAAIFIVFRKSICAFVKNLFLYRQYGKNPVEIYKRSPSVHIFTLAVLATGVTGVIGILLEGPLTAARGNLILIALMWLVTGTILLITDKRKKTRMGLRQFGIMAAIVIGLAQAVAILPGVSRAGATICAAILVGLHRRWAVEFSFLLAIPAILGATLVELIHNFDKINSGSLPIDSVLVGTLAAAVTGIFALKLLLKTTRSAKLKYFAFYCYALACAVLVYLMS
jgi:undecaprenyl-diphosphatase